MSARAFPDEPDLSPKEAAELSGLSYWTVLREIERGQLPAFKRPGGKLAIRRDDFCAWAYGNPVVPRDRAPESERGPRASRARPARGSVASLDELERRRGVG